MEEEEPKEWVEPSRILTTAVDENMRRNDQLLHCHEQIQKWQVQRDRLYEEWQQRHLMTALSSSGGLASKAWYSLHGNDRRKKAHLLAILQADVLPSCLTKASFWQDLPKELQIDRELLLARLKRPEFAFWCKWEQDTFMLNPIFWDDNEVVVAAVQAYPAVLKQEGCPYHVFEDPRILQAVIRSNVEDRERYLKLFSLQVLKNERLMLEALARGIRVWSILPGSLRNSRDFALAAADILLEKGTSVLGERCLKVFFTGIRVDLSVVRAFVRADGKSLQYASYSLRRNLDLVTIAAQNSPSALAWCLKGKTRTRLVHSKPFLLELFSSRGQQVLDMRVWDTLPSELQADRDIALAVLRKFRNMAMEMLPASLLQDTSIWVDLARLGKLLYISDAHALTDDLCYQLLQQQNLNQSVMGVIVKHLGGFPHEAWFQLNPCQSYEVLEDLLLKYIWPGLLHNKQLMIKFCSNKSALDLIFALNRFTESSPLMEDYEVLTVMISTDYDALRQLPRSVQTLYPDLVVHWIENRDDVDELVLAIAEELWFNRDVALAWLRNADVPPPEGVNLLEIHSRDKEIMLAAAEFNWELRLIPDQFRSDKDFLCEAVARNGDVWTLLGGEWKRNFDVALSAFGRFRDLAYCCTRNDFEFMVGFAKSIRNELGEFDDFVKYILGSIDLSGGANCPFNLLDQGWDTSLVYKRLIAEYLGVPHGSKLKLLRQASANLAKWGY